MTMGVLLTPSTVTTRLAEFLAPNAAGTCRLICVSAEKITLPAMPSNVTATLLPERCDPISVASDPATSGATCREAAFSTWLTITEGVTGGGGGGAAPHSRSANRNALAPAALPPLTMIVASEKLLPSESWY